MMLEKENCSPLKKRELKKWTQEERDMFDEAIRIYGKNWQLVTDHVGTRTEGAIKQYGYKRRAQLSENLDSSNRDIYNALCAETAKNTKRKSRV